MRDVHRDLNPAPARHRLPLRVRASTLGETCCDIPSSRSSLRAWEAVLAGLLFVVGMFDMFTPNPSRPNWPPLLPNPSGACTGSALTIGSGLVLIAIFGRFKPWARRAERMG